MVLVVYKAWLALDFIVWTHCEDGGMRREYQEEKKWKTVDTIKSEIISIASTRPDAGLLGGRSNCTTVEQVAK